MEEVRCNLCGGNHKEPFLLVRDWILNSQEKFNIVRCKDCGLVFLSPRPTKEEIVRYYPDEHYDCLYKGNDPYSFLRPKRVKLIKKYVKSGKILDIGSSGGGFLREAEEAGFDPYGIELSVAGCKYAKKLGVKNIVQGDVENLPLSQNTFQIVTLWSVLEHIYDPLSLLVKINRSMTKDGILVVEVPNFGSLQRKISKDKWYGFVTPQHLYFFTESTLSKMLNKTGFRVVKISYRSNFYVNFVSFKIGLLRNIKFERRDSNRRSAESKILDKDRSFLKSFFNWFCIIVSIILSFLKSSDEMTVFAKKNNTKDECETADRY